jgi:hypothetical protein
VAEKYLELISHSYNDLWHFQKLWYNNPYYNVKKISAHKPLPVFQLIFQKSPITNNLYIASCPLSSSAGSFATKTNNITPVYIALNMNV